jgi:hypothetical protein
MFDSIRGSSTVRDPCRGLKGPAGGFASAALTSSQFAGEVNGILGLAEKAGYLHDRVGATSPYDPLFRASNKNGLKKLLSVFAAAERGLGIARAMHCRSVVTGS